LICAYQPVSSDSEELGGALLSPSTRGATMLVDLDPLLTFHD
jgi:hypothetical protein